MMTGENHAKENQLFIRRIRPDPKLCKKVKGKFFSKRVKEENPEGTSPSVCFPDRKQNGIFVSD